MKMNVTEVAKLNKLDEKIGIRKQVTKVHKT
jgi:hypothetical protein